MRQIVARHCQWQTAMVAATKLRIKAELDAVERLGTPAARREHALSRLHSLDGDTKPAALLERFVLIMSVLVHHLRVGGLTERQQRDLAALAYATLQVCGVKPQTSRLASLHGELAVVLGQISRQEGRHWQAAWEQATASYLAGSSPPGGEDYMDLMQADRALRLGSARLALESYERVEVSAAPEGRREKAHLGRVKALRLSGQFEVAVRLHGDFQGRLSDDGKRELAWEEICCAAQRDRNVRPLLDAAARGGTHHVGTFILEAWLWARAVDRRLLVDFPTMRYLGRKKSGVVMAPHRSTFLSAVAIEQAVDSDAPLPSRLAQLGEALTDVSEVMTIDKELLVWAAAARALEDIRSFAQASLARDRYRHLSLALSDGRNADTLGLLPPEAVVGVRDSA